MDAMPIRSSAGRPEATSGGRRYGGESRLRRQEERRGRLLRAGRDLYGTVGYQATTVDAVCAEAGLTKRYFYESFAGREVLLCAVFEWLSAGVADEMRAAIDGAGPDPSDRVRAGLRAFFTAIRSDPAAARVLLVEVLGVSTTVDVVYRKVVLGLTALVGEMLGPLPGRLGRADSGPVDAGPIDPGLVVDALTGAALHLAVRWVLTGFDRSAESVVASCHAVYAAVLRG
jgi:AcrR family transcriptional regulator